MIVGIYYVELPEHPEYRVLAELSARTAVKANPGHRIVHLTDSETAELSGATEVMRLDYRVTLETLIPSKAFFHGWLGQNAEEPWCVVDADVIHKSDISVLLDDCDVAVLRRNRPAMIINAGIFLGRPGFRDFWAHYFSAINELISRGGKTLPPHVHPWWCEQIAMSLLVGCTSTGAVERLGARVKLHEMDEVFPRPFKIEEARISNAAAIHCKGETPKMWFEQYAKEILNEAQADFSSEGVAA